MPAHSHAGIHSLPEHKMVARILTDYDPGEQLVDDSLCHSRSNGSLRLTEANESIVSDDFHDHGVDRLRITVATPVRRGIFARDFTLPSGALRTPGAAAPIR